MDRFDDLLIKARAEMIGKTPTRKVITKDSAFNAAWDLVKGYEDQMRALQAKRNKPPGFFGRMKQGYQSTRNSPSQQNEAVPLPTGSNGMRATTQTTGDGGFVDFMGQQGDLDAQSKTTRASGSPPSMDPLGPGGLGQGGGVEPPQALKPEEVPMRRDINTEQPPAPAPPASAPVETKRTQSLPPTMRPEGIGPSQRAENFGPPSNQRLFDAFNTLNPDNEGQRETMMRVSNPEKRTVGATTTDATRPLDVADIPMANKEPTMDSRTNGKLGDRRDSARDEEYKRIEEQRNRISDRRVKRINRGNMTSSQAIEELKRIRQAGKYPDRPTMEEQTEPSLDEANRALGGDEIVRPNTRSPAVETPIQETREGGVPTRRTGMGINYPGQSTALVPTKKEPAIESLEPEEVMAMQHQPQGQGGVPAVRDKAPATEAPATKALPPGKLPMLLPERTPAPQPEPQVKEQSEPVKKPEPKPQVEEQTHKEPPTSKQATLFGGKKQTTPKPKDDKATVEAAQGRKADRAENREATQALPRIGADTDSEAISALMGRAEEGDEKARKHLYDSMGDLEDHHPSQAERYNELFGKMPQEANLSLLPSGMRQSILKDNDTDVNYSLLPNGWA